MIHQTETHLHRVKTHRQQYRLDIVRVDACAARHEQCRARDKQVGSLRGGLCHLILQLFTVGEAVMQQSQPSNATAVDKYVMYIISMIALVMIHITDMIQDIDRELHHC